MKFLIVFCFILGTAFAECDIEPLKNEIITEYKTNLPVTNEKGEIGHAKAKNFKVADYLMKLKNENLLIANFDLDIKWMNGKKQTVKSLVVATVNPQTCSIEKFDNKSTSNPSMAQK